MIWAIYDANSLQWWHEGFGWVGSVHHATMYTDEEANRNQLPIPGKWIRVG